MKTNRPIVICADNDDPNQTYPNAGGTGVAKAMEAAHAAEEIHVCVCPRVEDKKTDFNDLALAKGLEAVKYILDKALAEEPESGGVPPEGFELKPAGKDPGIYSIGKDGNKERLGPLLQVMSSVRNNNNTKWGKEVKFRDPDGKEHRDVIGFEEINSSKGQIPPILANHGYMPLKPTFAQKIVEYISRCSPSRRVRICDSIGWQNQQCYLTPHKTYGDTDGEIYRLTSQVAEKLFEENGTLDAWMKIPKLCSGNDVMMFVLSLAFAALLLGLTDIGSGGILLEGNTSIGKTTMIEIATSVIGHPKNCIHTWNLTANAAEILASCHNDSILPMDELSEADPNIIELIVYMFGNGEGKARATVDGTLRDINRWRTMIIAAGEDGLSKKLEEGCKKKKGGVEVRISGIPVDKAHIKNLHEKENEGALVKEIKQLANENYGKAGNAFLKHITDPKNLQLLKERLPIAIETRVKKLTTSSDGKILRVAQRFALASYAAKIAVRAGILPKKFEDSAYIQECFDSWVSKYAKEVRRPDLEVLEDVITFLKDNREHFLDLRKQDTAKKIKKGAPWGYTGFGKSNCATSDVIMDESNFDKLIPDGHTRDTFLSLLKDYHRLRYDDGRLKKKLALPGQQQARWIVIACVFADGYC